MIDARLIHYSTQPLTQVLDAEQTGPADYKPNGLWFSVGDGDDGWRAWCESEMPEWIKGRVATEITLSPDAKMLWISGERGLDKFTAEYGVTPPWGPGPHYCVIDWHKIAASHHGIIISPYIWSRRLTPHTSWYYGWDCASGVIWSAEAVEDLHPVNLWV